MGSCVSRRKPSSGGCVLKEPSQNFDKISDETPKKPPPDEPVIIVTPIDPNNVIKFHWFVLYLFFYVVIRTVPKKISQQLTLFFTMPPNLYIIKTLFLNTNLKNCRYGGLIRFFFLKNKK